MKKQSLVICGFPGVGKTTLTSKYEHLENFIRDLDSSEFPKVDFPENYLESIKQCIEDEVKVILVSSHIEIREALHKCGIPFLYVQPGNNRKTEFLENYSARGDSEEYITRVQDNWDSWTTEAPGYGKNIVMGKNQEFLSDMINERTVENLITYLWKQQS